MMALYEIVFKFYNSCNSTNLFNYLKLLNNFGILIPRLGIHLKQGFFIILFVIFRLKLPSKFSAFSFRLVSFHLELFDI